MKKRSIMLIGIGLVLVFCWMPHAVLSVQSPRKHEEVLVQIEKLGGVVSRSLNGDSVDISFESNGEKTRRFSIPMVSPIEQGLQLLRRLPDHFAINLSLEGSDIKDASISYFRGLKGICALTLSDTSITDGGLAQLQSLENLRYLSLSRNKITGIGFDRLKINKRLEKLMIFEDEITDAGMRSIGMLTSIKSLELSSLSITDIGLANLKGMISLSELTLYHNAITGTGLLPLSSLTRLRILYITEDLSITGLKSLGALRNLEKLGICYRGDLDDEAFVHVENLSNLIELRITDDDGFVSGLGDKGVGYLSQLGHLEKLELSGTRISDSGVARLGALQKLKILRLYNTMVTRQGAIALKKDIPGLHIELVY